MLRNVVSKQHSSNSNIEIASMYIRVRIWTKISQILQTYFTNQKYRLMKSKTPQMHIALSH